MYEGCDGDLVKGCAMRNDIWDKLMVAIPVDKRAAIVTGWTRITEKIKSGDIDIILVLKLWDLSKTISIYHNCHFYLVFKLLAQGHYFDSWRKLIMNCKDLVHLDNPATIDELKRTAKKLESDVKEHYGIKLSHKRSLNLIAWRFGFDNYEVAQSKMIPGPRTALRKHRKGMKRSKLTAQEVDEMFDNGAELS